MQGDVFLTSIFNESLLYSTIGIRADHHLAYSWGELVLEHSLVQSLQSVQESELAPEHLVQQASITFWQNDFTLRLGRFSLPWGLGTAFFPADALHHARSVDNDVRGFDGAAVIWTLHPDWTLSAALRTDTAVWTAADAPDREWWRELRYAFSLSAYPGDLAFFRGLELQTGSIYQHDQVFRSFGELAFGAGDAVIHSGFAYEGIGYDPAVTGSGPAEGVMSIAIGKGWAATAGMNYRLSGDLWQFVLLAEYMWVQESPVEYGSHFAYVQASLDSGADVQFELSGWGDIENSSGLVAGAIIIQPFDAVDFRLELAAEIDSDEGFGLQSGGCETRVYF